MEVVHINIEDEVGDLKDAIGRVYQWDDDKYHKLRKVDGGGVDGVSSGSAGDLS